MTDIEMDKIRAEIQKLFDDAAKSRAEAAKIMSVQGWFSFALGAGSFGAMAMFAKQFQ